MTLLVGWLLWTLPLAAQQGGVTVSGVVVNAGAQHGGRVSGAVVRQQTTEHATTSGADGTFTLGGLTEGLTMTITAWDEGYYPGGVEVVPPASGVTITLKPHPQGDNTAYEWYTSMPDPAEPLGCGHCMVAFPQWEQNAHAGAARNPRFLSLYNGTNLSGTQHLGGGYQDDFPGTAGNCATCHAPGAAVDAPFSTDMNQVSGVEAEGVFCDFCHKIGAAYLNPVDNMPYPNAPGVLSYRLYRPPAGTHMFFGPFDDVTRRVSYLQLEKESAFCAPCHQFSFWGTPIYESYAEWLASPYAEQGVECQDCHMVPTGVDYFVYPEQGGLIRPPEGIASHLQPGAADEELLQNTVELTLALRLRGDQLWATVTITNTEAGHHVPTDFPGRQMLLTITATDGEGHMLALEKGPAIPAWGGEQAGEPGVIYAKVLQDVMSGEYPVMSYWKQALIRSDNRIPALESDSNRFIFSSETALTLPVTVTAEVYFRRGFQAEMEARGWETPDILMESVTVHLLEETPARIYLPLLLRH